MLSPSDFNDAVPQFTNGNYASNPLNPLYVEEPGAIDYNRGVEPLQTLPAQWWNWLANQFTAKLNKINIYVKNIFDELTQLLSLFGVTPDGTEGAITTGQLKSVFQNSYPSFVADKPPILKTENETLSAGSNGRYNIDNTNIKYASTADITPLYGIQTVDGVTPTDGDYILVKDQSDATQNGLYIYNELGDWSRVTGYTTPANLLSKIFNVKNGSTNAGKMFYLSNTTFEDGSAFGTDNINFIEYFGAILPKPSSVAIRDSSGHIKTADPVEDDDCVNKRSMVSASFDAFFPKGMIYTQYPGKKSPNELWGGFSTWEEITDYSGAFFRASGGNAASFIEEGQTLSPQGQATALNGVHGNQQTADTSTDGNHTHSTQYAYTISSTTYGPFGNGERALAYTWTTSGDGGSHSHSVTFTPSISSSDTETRPVNYTVKIWERVS